MQLLMSSTLAPTWIVGGSSRRVRALARPYSFICSKQKLISFIPSIRSDANASLINGTITVDDIDTVLKRLFRLRLRLGQFDPPGPLSTIGPDQVRGVLDRFC